MRENELISVIIPVYNVQEYLEKCVNSVTVQTYENLEIILVNDGSIDNSGDICDKLVEQDKRIALINQENGGLSDARNTGTKAAMGKYIFYLDSDDYISSDCLENLYEAILKYDAEVAQTNFYYDYPDHLLYDDSLKVEEMVFTREEAMQSLLKQDNIKNFAWGKLIRADIAKQHTFPKGKYFEDTFWKFYIINECTRYVVLAKPMLYYLQRPASISGVFSVRNLHQLEGEAKRLDFIIENFSNLIPFAKASLKKKLQQHRSYLQRLSFEDQNLYFQQIKHYEDKYKIQPDRTLDKIKHNEDGLIVDISVKGLYQGVKKLIENEDLRTKFSKSTITEVDYKIYVDNLLALK